MALSRARVRKLADALPDDRARILAKMSPRDVLRFDAWFEAWAHEGQLPPPGKGWRTWLLMAGRGYGKTRAGAEWVHALARGRGRTRIALVGATIDEARRIMVEGRSGLLAVAANHGVRLRWEPSHGTLRWPGGAQAQVFSGESPEGLRGPEHHFAWCDELAKWRCPEESWDNLQMGLRAGRRPRALVTTTPRPMQLLERLRASKRTIETGGTSFDNISLPSQFLEVMAESYGGTRLGRQELDGELLGEAEGSLFPRWLIERQRKPERLPFYDRVVVGVDPPITSGGDLCGIVVVGRKGNECHVLADRSAAKASPDGWARQVAKAAEEFEADRVIAEANQGGDMVKSVLWAARQNLPVTLVYASKGKVARAEPIAAGFEAGRHFFAGRFDRLEDQLSGLQAGGDYEGPGRSPDRADAMVWALWALDQKSEPKPNVRRI